MADESEVDIRDLAATVIEAIDVADSARAGALSDLVDLHVARGEVLLQERELRRALNEEDLRLQTLDQRLAAQVVAGRSLSLEAVRAATEPPAPNPEAWKVYGRVVAADGYPVPSSERLRGARAVLVDSRERPVAGAEPARLDESAGFLIEVALKPGTGARKIDPAVSARALPNVLVAIVDRSGDTIACDDQPIAPAAGTVTYREIVLSPEREADDDAETSSAAEEPGTKRAAAPPRQASGRSARKSRRPRSGPEAQ
ncbi:hypothetical protein [Mycolicibacterium iranicum]|uniref:Uncharacterized protein n=1 Tax=Mycolicibacterium iranicum TaxID=912594 RepID=A0A178LS25_MYCIR|nr:hypothetical protein [Mycolicibacterium iranicum]OAN36789.1 hypothetical protein A4X20_06230 [Mycolicibacterium iranicum]